MTCGELIEALRGLDPKSVVLVSSDPEGNSFCVATAITSCATVHDPQYRCFPGDVYCGNDADEIAENLANGHVKAVVIWP